MKKLFAILFFCFVACMYGQIPTKAAEALAKKDLGSLRKYAHDVETDIILEQLSPAFQKGTLRLDHFELDLSDSSVHRTHCWRILFLVRDSTMVYYDLCEEKKKKVTERVPAIDTIAYADKWLSYLDTLITFRDTAGLKEFVADYKKLFACEPDVKQVFSGDELVYGGHCGYGGIPTRGYMGMEEFVEMENSTALIQWLQSSVAVKQVFAIEGLYTLKKKGKYKPTEQELQMIRFVKKKKSYVETCSGCIHDYETINKLTKRFRF